MLEIFLNKNLKFSIFFGTQFLSKKKKNSTIITRMFKGGKSTSKKKKKRPMDLTPLPYPNTYQSLSWVKPLRHGITQKQRKRREYIKF
jgi:hypothetical protein